MNNRERFRAALAFERLDRPCQVEQGLLPTVYEHWLGEGLAAGVQPPAFEYLGPQPDVFAHAGILGIGYVLAGQYAHPPVGGRIIEQTDRYTVSIDNLGRTVKQLNDQSAAPLYLDHAVKTPRDYDALREALAPQMTARYPENWDTLARTMREQDQRVVATHMDGFYGFPRLLLGDERLLLSYYTDPEFVRRIIDDRVAFYIAVYEKAIADVRPDMAFIWEDMCYRNGPLISPALFREFMTPAYRKLTSFLRDMGVTNIVVDSDGDIREMIPLWLEAGVTGLLPFEVKTGMDVVRIAEQYPRLQIIGGIDKHRLERADTGAFDAELERVLRPLLRRGGYVVSLDHWIHPQIPYRNFRHYVDRVRNFKL